ncbi:unnamed protein product [Discosporangium mesarthrocarpum]
MKEWKLPGAHLTPVLQEEKGHGQAKGGGERGKEPAKLKKRKARHHPPEAGRRGSGGWVQTIASQPPNPCAYLFFLSLLPFCGGGELRLLRRAPSNACPPTAP